MNISVYSVHFDLERYQSLLFDGGLASIPDLNGTSVLDIWSSPAVYSDNTELESPDFWHLTVIGRSFALTQNAIHRLEPFLSTAGELLPLTNHADEDDAFFAFNVLNVLRVDECIDLIRRAAEREELLRIYSSDVTVEDYEDILRGVADGDPWPVLYPDFVSERLPADPTFFRVDRLPSMLFVLDWDDAGDTLLRRVSRFNMTGLVFRKVWSSRTGAAEINLLG